METQNVTLAIPKSTLRKAKLLAVQRQTSLSGLMTQLLNDLVSREDQYAAARERNLALLEQGLDLGTHGNITWRREDLYDR
jgi:hypothetical protein